MLALPLALFGNTMIIMLIQAHPLLHSSMYHLLMDLLSISTLVLNALNFLSGDHHSSFITCDIQLFLFITLMKAERLLLAVMTYDCNVAI